MSGNGKQVQLAPNQSQRYPGIPTRPLTPQRTDGFSMASGGVSGGYVTSNTAGGHHTVRGLPQAPTPPQQDLKQPMYQQQGNVRAPQYPQQPYRGAPPQGQPGVGIVHHQQRPTTHLRQQNPGGPTQTPPPAGWPGQQVMYNVPVFLPTHMPLPQTSYLSQQPTRAQFYSQPAQHSISMMPQHPQYFCPPSQQPYAYGGPSRGGPSPGQMAPTQSIPPQQQAHPYVPTRYSSPMTHSTTTNEKKSRSRAIPIIDPKSGKEVVQDDNMTTNESGDRQSSHQDENSLAVCQEFARLITDAANEKDDVDDVSKEIDIVTITDEGNLDNEVSNQSSCNDLPAENKSEMEYSEDNVKHNQLCELNETPVVSAISNSPEIVPKQCHIVKQKQIENISSDNKKSQLSKAANKSQTKPLSEALISEDLSCVKNQSNNELGAQQILTSALQSSKLIEEDVKIEPLQVSENAQLNVVEIVPTIPATNSNAILVADTTNIGIPMTPEDVTNVLSVTNENVVQPEVVNQLPTSEKPKTETKKQKLRQNDQVDQTVSQIHVFTPESSPETHAIYDNSNSVVINNTESLQQDVNVSNCNQDVTLVSEVDVSVVERNLENSKVTNRIEDQKISEDISTQMESDNSQNVDKVLKTVEVIDNAVNSTGDNGTTEVDLKSTPVDMEKKESDVDNEEVMDDKPKGPVLRYNYKEDQWSPLNTSGKKYYDSDFLMALRNNPNSKKKPDNLTQTDILADNLGRQPRNNDVTRLAAPGNYLLPVYAKGVVHNATPNRKSQHNKPLKDSKGNPAPGQGVPNRPNIIHVNLSLRSDVKLNESENAWKPARMRQENLSEEELQTRELCKTFTSVLNKLTPQNFDTLIAQVRNLNINTEDRLEKVIALVFEKAIDEPNFSLTYALMCKELSGITLPSTEKSNVTFRTLIVRRCQTEFEKNDDTAKRLQKDIDECTDIDKKKEMMLNLEEVESKIRRRSVGNVRFIGEIFKQNLIKHEAIIGCIKQLLNEVEEETLECLCKLLTTIGKNLEKIHKQDLQPYFNIMRGIVENKRKELSSRVRFMIQDVIDLRLNNWVPRQQVVNPKTMEQIKLEVELEQNKPPIFSNYAPSANAPRKDDRPNNMNKRGGSKSVTEEGWSQAPSRNARNKPTNNFVVDSGKLSKISFTPVTQTSLQPSTQNAWWQGSAVSKKTDTVQTSSHKPSRNSSSTSKKPATEISNTYHVLENQYSDNTTSSNLDASTRKLSYKSKGASIERSTFKSEESEDPIGSTSSECAEKIKEVLAYAHSDTVYGMLGRIQQNIKNTGDTPSLCKELIVWGLRFKKKENMVVIGEVTGTLVDDEMITSDEFCKVLKDTMDVISSQVLQEGDPIICKMLGGFIWAHMKKNNLNLEQIHTAFSKVIELEYGFDLLTSIFIEKLKESPNDIKMLWEKSSLTLSDWMDEDRVDQFSEEFPLKWIYQKGVITPEEACTQMLKQMQEGKSRDQVKDWIQKNVGSAVHEAWFIRALTEAIHTYGLCCHEAPKKPTLDTSRLEKFYPLLSTYIGGQEKQELECLFAIQRLINKHEHPQGITGQLFEYLWECGDIVSLEGITTWEKNKDPKEQEGKGVILKTLTSFLTSIKSEEQSSDEANSIICEEGY